MFKRLIEAESVPKWYPVSLMAATLRLLIGMMDQLSKETPPVSLETLNNLLQACEDADTFSIRNEFPQAYIALNLLRKVNWIGRLRKGNEAYRYLIICDVFSEEYEQCVAYYSDAMRRLQIKYQRKNIPQDGSAVSNRIAVDTAKIKACCKWCGLPIVWSRTQVGNYMPLDVEMTPLEINDSQHIVVMQSQFNEQRVENFCITPGNAYAAIPHMHTCEVIKRSQFRRGSI